MFSTTLYHVTRLLQVGWIVGGQTVWWALGAQSFERCVERVCGGLVKLSVLYVKLFQAMALNADWVDPSVRQIVLRFTDNPPFSPDEVDHATLDLLAEYHGWTVTDRTRPLNAGMISLVYLATSSQTQQPVIVKLKRRGIDARLADAIAQVEFFLGLLDWLPAWHNMQVSNVIRKNIDTIRQQTNFAVEAANQTRFRQNFQRVKYVRIPEVHLQWPELLVMEYLAGARTIAHLPHSEYPVYAKLVLKFSFATSMLHSLSHGDLHAGNLLFLRDEATNAPVLGVLDFGIVYPLSATYKQMLYDVFANVIERSPRQTAERMLDSNYLEPPGIVRQLPAEQYLRLLDFTEQLIDECVNRRNGRTQIQMFAFVSRLSDALQQPEVAALGIRVSDDFVQTQMMLAMSHGVAHTLTGGDLMPAVNEAMDDLFHLSWMLGDEGSDLEEK